MWLENGKKFNIAILVQILVYFWKCTAKTCHRVSFRHAHAHAHTHTLASLPFNKIQTVPSLFMTGLVKPQRNRIPSNYNVREPLPRPQTGLSLAVPDKLPYSLHPHSLSVLQTDCLTHLCYFTTERTKMFVRPVIPVLCSTLCGGGGLVL